MDVRNCQRCGTIFPYAGKPYCRKCVEREEQDFTMVKKFLHDNPHSTVDEVHEETGVARDAILRLLREGRLVATAGLAGAISCEWCGRPIDSGRRCKTCTDKVQQDLKQVLPPAGTQEEPGGGHNRMYTSGLIRDRRVR